MQKYAILKRLTFIKVITMFVFKHEEMRQLWKLPKTKTAKLKRQYLKLYLQSAQNSENTNEKFEKNRV